MKIRKNFFMVLSLCFLLLALLSGCGDSKESNENHVEAAEEVMEMLHDLCDIAGYGIHSGIQTQPKADQAANYIVERIIAKDRGAIGIIRAGLQVDSPQFHKNDPTRPPDIFPIPVFSVGKNVGDYLRDLATSASPPNVRMVLEVPHQTFNAHNVVFEMAGNGSMDEIILVGTHYDTGMFTGAVDNNGSVALMIAWAKNIYLESILNCLRMDGVSEYR